MLGLRRHHRDRMILIDNFHQIVFSLKNPLELAKKKYKKQYVYQYTNKSFERIYILNHILYFKNFPAYIF